MTLLEQLKLALDNGPLYRRALAPRLEGRPIGLAIASSARTMSNQEIAEWIKADNQAIRDPGEPTSTAELARLAECELRLAILTSELERRHDGGKRQEPTGCAIHGEIFVAADGEVFDRE